jgi:CHAD domain-containing protein
MKRETNNLASFAEARATERLKTLTANLRLAKKHPGEAGPIHDLRVSIRRFNQSLRIFKDLWNHGRYRKMRRRLRRLMELCGAVRNCDIAIQVLEEAGAPAKASLKTHLRKLRLHGENALKERLQDWDFHWRGWVRPRSGKNRAVNTRVRQVLGPLEREYAKAGRTAARPETNPEKLHELRLAAKHLRYTLEIFGPLAGAEWEQEIERIREVQELLGAVNDCVTTSALIKEHDHDAAAVKRLLGKRLALFRRGAGHRPSRPAISKKKRGND